jgi:hypothetical protein
LFVPADKEKAKMKEAITMGISILNEIEERDDRILSVVGLLLGLLQ